MVESNYSKNSIQFDSIGALSSFEIPPSAPFLILTGDIGRLIDYDACLAFFSKITIQFEKVLLVLGNHGFYSHLFASGLKMVQKLEEEPVLNGKLILLYPKRYDVPGSSVSILGCTLWSKIAEESKSVVQMRQVAMISVENNTSVNRTSRREIPVVTHNAPSVQETASPEQAGNAWSSAFATDVIWRFSIRIVSNQRGYVLPDSAEKKSNARDDKKVYDVRRVVHLR
ncbi:hypothetical protein NA56DRAFT_675121 [Hyaloscypha hepaticicola]|uniref:Calcineurin-like phosphoesterase domain-containing protein n=1 Tax=Hyaloscypha hepaticicola TaxID=2082293 RepID=A0A2J6PFF7_9HELO|nr:hypothetical protein NA56DRAFT_675121 [Hyaloscypha hepaticicola]